MSNFRVNKSTLVVTLVLAIFFSLAFTFAMYLAEGILPNELHLVYELIKINDIKTFKDAYFDFAADYNVSAESLFISLYFVQIVFPPLPGQLLGVLSGLLFGPWYGFLLCIIGMLIGSTIVLILTRAMRNIIVKKRLLSTWTKRFDYVMDTGSSATLFLLILLPATPDDALLMVAGLTKIPIKNLLFLSVIARLPGTFIAVYSGHTANESYTFLVIFSLISLFIFVMAYLNEKKIDSWLRERF